MTILTAQGLLYKFFETNDFFNKTHLKKLITISENPEADEAAIYAALESFEKSELVKKIEHNKNVYYLLLKPFSAYNQTVQVSAPLAKEIAELINKYCEQIGNDAELVNPHAITEYDIKKLLVICLNLGKKDAEEE